MAYSFINYCKINFIQNRDYAIVRVVYSAGDNNYVLAQAHNVPWPHAHSLGLVVHGHTLLP